MNGDECILFDTVKILNIDNQFATKKKVFRSGVETIEYTRFSIDIVLPIAEMAFIEKIKETV